MAYVSGGGPPNDTTTYRGTFGQIGGVNANGNIYNIGGYYVWKEFGKIKQMAPFQWWDRINVYDSFIAYDKSVDSRKTLTQLQEPWSSSMDSFEFSMPNPTRPANRSFPSTWAANASTWNYQGGFLCLTQCSTYLNNRIYIINPLFFSQEITQPTDWPLMIIFDMNDTNPRYLSEQEFTSVPPNNFWAAGKNGTGPYDILEIEPDGCTTHNGTHIFHFNWAENQVGNQYSYDPYSTTYAYDPQSDEWTVLTGNPHDKFQFTCSSDLSGRYIYLIGGNFKYKAAGETEVNVDSFETDQYDTWTDSWTRLPHTADYPEQYGRWDAYSVLDRSTNSIVVIGGTIVLNPCNKSCLVSSTKVEIFRCDTLDWYVPSDPMDQIYFETSPKSASVVIVHDFVPPGQTSNKSADIIFALGGGKENKIQFLTMLTAQEYYPDNIVRIEGQYPEDETIEWTAFDPWQRFELAFRIVITDGIAYEIDDTWDISFSIDGKSIADINDEYGTQILARPACQCGRNEDMRCENMPDNVIQVTTVELMIPSVDCDLPWIFSYEIPSNITITTTNGAVTHERNFTFEFMKIELVSPHPTTTTEDPTNTPTSVPSDDYASNPTLVAVPHVVLISTTSNYMLKETVLSNSVTMSSDDETMSGPRKTELSTAVLVIIFLMVVVGVCVLLWYLYHFRESKTVKIRVKSPVADVLFPNKNEVYIDEIGAPRKRERKQVIEPHKGVDEVAAVTVGNDEEYYWEYTETIAGNDGHGLDVDKKNELHRTVEGDSVFVTQMEGAQIRCDEFIVEDAEEISPR